MEVDAEAWRVHLNPKTWMTGKHARGDGNPDKKQVKTPARRLPAVPSINGPEPENFKGRPLLKVDSVATRDREQKPKKPVTLCFHNKKKKFCTVPCKEREPSLGSMAASCNDNCCRCCAIVAKYLQDVFRCVYCLVNCRLPHTRFRLLARQFVTAAGGVCSDCVYIVRYILKFLIGEN